MNWLCGFEPICQADAPLAPYTWYKLGGAARWLCAPRDAAETAALIARLNEERIDWRILGRGANILVPDEGFDGAVIRLIGPTFESVRYMDDRGVVAGAGVDFTKFIRQTLEHGLIGLEVLAGVPGTVGGLVRMNAGGKHGETGQFVQAIEALSPDGRVVTLSKDQIGFSYRHTHLDGHVVLSATMELTPGDSIEGLARHKQIWNEKAASQPKVAQRSAGCVFKNPPSGSAGRLLDQSGLKGVRVGGAEISSKHANFILAHPGATASDVLGLARLARDRVYRETGVELQMEVDVWQGREAACR